jgi:flagellar protein FliO/FliZ
MFDLFGAEMPLAVRFFLAFLIVLVLIGVAAWAVRRLGSAGVKGAVRGRQPRLAVIDDTAVDSRRRLILVRRDNVEHLVMIGGRIDVVVESHIVRAVPVPHEATISRDPTPAETLARAVPLPEDGSNGSWPLQPEQPVLRPRAPRNEPMPEEHGNIPLMPSEPPPRPYRGAGNAPVDDITHRQEPHAPAQPAATGGRSAAADQSLAEMAQRLDAALRKPKSVEPNAVAPPAPQQADEPKAAGSPTHPSYDSLEQEMASLLGRPPNKT